jgi:hypothetical protein
MEPLSVMPSGHMGTTTYTVNRSPASILLAHHLHGQLLGDEVQRADVLGLDIGGVGLSRSCRGSTGSQYR